MKRLTDKEISQVLKDIPSKPTSHSVQGITVTVRELTRDASGKFVVVSEKSSNSTPQS